MNSYHSDPSFSLYPQNHFHSIHSALRALLHEFNNTERDISTTMEKIYSEPPSLLGEIGPIVSTCKTCSSFPLVNRPFVGAFVCLDSLQTTQSCPAISSCVCIPYLSDAYMLSIDCILACPGRWCQTSIHSFLFFITFAIPSVFRGSTWNWNGPWELWCPILSRETSSLLSTLQRRQK